MKEEILLRSDATLANVDTKQRLIDVIAVPWEQEAEVFWRGEVWKEVFNRGAFNGLEGHAGRIPVNREHMKGDTVGKVVTADPHHSEGLLLRVKVAKTLRGDDTLALASEDMVAGSVGYFTKEGADVRLNAQTKLRRVIRGFLEHFSFVEVPAYAGARVLAVREESPRLAVVETPLPPTPNLDEFLNDPALEWARRRVSS